MVREPRSRVVMKEVIQIGARCRVANCILAKSCTRGVPFGLTEVSV